MPDTNATSLPYSREQIAQVLWTTGGGDPNRMYSKGASSGTKALLEAQADAMLVLFSTQQSKDAPIGVGEEIERKHAGCGGSFFIYDSRVTCGRCGTPYSSCTIDALIVPTVQALGPHEVCENSRDCIKCGKRIPPAGGLCFGCATEATDNDEPDHLWHGSGAFDCPPTCPDRKAGDNG